MNKDPAIPASSRQGALGSPKGADQLIARFATNLRDQGRSPSTVDSYGRDAKRFMNYLSESGSSLGQADAESFLQFEESLRAVERPNSVRRTLIGVRVFFRFLVEDRYLATSPLDGVPIPERLEIAPASLKPAQIDELLRWALKNLPEVKGLRDAAILGLLAFEGVKASELIRLRWVDFLVTGETAALRIVGPRARSLVLAPRTAALILAYQRAFSGVRHKSLERAREKRMFVAFQGRDSSVIIPHLTRHGLKFIIYELGKWIAVSHLNAEQLRDFAVTQLLQGGRSTDEVMQHLGLRRMGNIARHLDAGDAPGRSTPPSS